MAIVADRIFQLLKEKNKSQKELAEYLCLSENTISKWKKGLSNSYYSYFDRIAEYFQIDITELSELAEIEKTLPKRYAVYKHTSPSGKIYIGITETVVERRWKAGNGYQQNTHFYNAIKKYGWNSFKHEVLFSNLTAEEAAKREIELIEFYHSDNRDKGYNISPGGDLMSESTKEKIRKSRNKKGLNQQQSLQAKEYWNDPEWREKTINSMRGKKRTEEQIEHYKAARAKQPPMSDKARQKIREKLSAKTGENSVRKKTVLQIEPVTMKVIKKYPTAREAAAAVGASINCIATICRKRIDSNLSRASHHYFWCYEEDYRPEDFELYRGIQLTENGKLPRSGVRASGYKRKHTDIAKQKISKANAIPVVCIETGKKYQSTTIAAKEYGVTRDAIYKCAKGINKTCAGMHWKFLSEEEGSSPLAQLEELALDPANQTAFYHGHPKVC